MAVFLVFCLLGLGAAGFGEESKEIPESGILGGPSAARAAEGISSEEPVLLSQSVILGRATAERAVQRDFHRLDDSEAFLDDLGKPIGPTAYRSDLFIYRVQEGDTLSRIASDFGVSVQTLIDANPKVRASSLRIGDELLILPVSGLVYQTKDGDELESIASRFGMREDRILEANPSVNFSVLDPGVPIVIPGAKRADFAYAIGGNLSDLGAHFIMPAEGFNWGKLHRHNAVDIANTCGVPVRAAAEGLVIPDESFGDGVLGWNGGYGKFILIEHPLDDKVRTRYAHLNSVSVEIGNYVRQGQEIGTIGQSGDATGCHLHFEVYGAQNPFAKY
ncbi:M23 family metallopeptidase [Candidatus Parcubacteria bacterium]|nr:MAG: M23 family metallopeptidase [Candidatus Parcubacteria bacterium]